MDKNSHELLMTVVKAMIEHSTQADEDSRHTFLHMLA